MLSACVSIYGVSFSSQSVWAQTAMGSIGITLAGGNTFSSFPKRVLSNLEEVASPTPIQVTLLPWFNISRGSKH